MEDKKNPVPKWLVKGNKCFLPDGNMVIFTGEKKDDFCILIKDEKEKFHVNLTIKPDKYLLQTKDERTGEHRTILDIYSEPIIDLCYHWQKKLPHLVKVIQPKFWKNHNEKVVDINSSKIPVLTWAEENYDVDPEIVENYSMPKKDILNLKFSAGLMFNDLGRCQGMLMPHKKFKKLVLIDKSLLFKIFNTVIGIDKLKPVILLAYDEYKKTEKENVSK